jgi:hypothetical protein
MVMPVPAMEMRGPAQFDLEKAVVPENVTVVPDLSLVRSRVVLAGTVMPLTAILVHEETAGR